jgi:uncharacterized protein YbjT (DUF2867 family)
MFALNALGWWAPQIRAGDVVRWPYLNVATAPIDERDIAAVAVRTLCEDAHSGANYVLTGPQSLSQFEQIATIGSVLGRSLCIHEISAEEWLQELPSYLPSFVAKYLGTPGLLRWGIPPMLRPQWPSLWDGRHERFLSGPRTTLCFK